VTPSTKILDIVADSFNPLLALVALAVSLLKPRSLRRTIVFYIAAGVAIGFVYLVRAIDNHYQLWSSLGLDYSTHSAFAASLVVSIGAFKRRWLAPLSLAALAYFALEVLMRYHGVADVVSSASLGAVAALVVHFAVMREFQVQGQESKPDHRTRRQS
jgi:hypothetical protein